MTTQIQFLHVMREADYLEQALRDGLMFTDHRVKFNPFGDDMGAAAQAMADYAMPRLVERATALGATDLNLNALAYGLGSIAGDVPMICFTEVHESRDLCAHYMNFGAYGVVVSKQWLEGSGGDRVIYAGAQSAVTRNLHRIFVDLQIANVHVENGGALFDNRALEGILDLFAYVQGRDQLAEAEWRIAGSHGFMGGRRASGDRIPLPVSEIDAVLVQREDDVPRFEALLASLAAKSGASKVPTVHRQPDTLPNSRPLYRSH